MNVDSVATSDVPAGMTPPPSRASTRRPLWMKRSLWWLVALLALAIAGFSVPPYLMYDANASRIPLNLAVPSHMLWLSAHAVPAALALALGPLQFVPALRARHPVLHRYLGSIYLVCVLIGGIAATAAALVSTSGLTAQAGLLFLAVAWLCSGGCAYAAARNGRYAEHRIWMIRNYALTFSAVPLRLFLVAGQVAVGMNPSLQFLQIYAASVWGAIAICAFFAEWVWLGTRTGRTA